MNNLITDRHSKCDTDRPRCKPCARAGNECVRVSTRIKFKTGSSGRYDSRFGKEQPWLTRSKHARIHFVDQTPELENYYATDLEASDHHRAQEVADTDRPLSTIVASAEKRLVAQSTPSLDSHFSDPKPLDERRSPGAYARLRKRQRTKRADDVNASYRLPSIPPAPVLLVDIRSPALDIQRPAGAGIDLPAYRGTMLPAKLRLSTNVLEILQLLQCLASNLACCLQRSGRQVLCGQTSSQQHNAHV